ncbi:hypothetical protein [Gluconobacter oxydans]|uniref:hypothetical protein n=1 Tax=Gluconobacter oxydans TaxID=442 RepID=UPI001CD8E5F5|nr:hypothetical protein [Gluconobacter oxydans]
MSRTEALFALTGVAGVISGAVGYRTGAELALGILCAGFVLLQGHGDGRLGLCMFLGAMTLAALRMTGTLRETSVP